MKKHLHLFQAFLCLFLFFTSPFFANIARAQYPPQYGTPFTGVPDPRDVTIYQVNMRAFSSTHNFQGVINRLDSIKALGVNVIYLMPVYPVGVLKSVNSPYCIRSFDSVGSEFGALSDLQNLVNGAHSRNMAVILDWVVNQTSWDHPWITQHPSWYLQDGNGNIEQLDNYPDVAALNFSNDSMRIAMITAMKSWVYRANIDGFRCDFADNPPIDFWQQTIDTLRNITTHNLLLLAEGSRSANYGAGFNYNFGFNFYGSLQQIFTDGGPVTDMDASDSVEYIGATGTNQIVRYLTNHDVDGTDGPPVSQFGGIPGSNAAFVAMAYRKGVPFVYNGTEEAFPTPITFPFLSVVINWGINPAVTTFYKQAIAFRDSSVAIRRGTLVSYDNNDICAYTKTSGSQEVAVLVNLRNSTITYPIPGVLRNTTWNNAFSGVSTTLGTSVSLAPYQYMVLTNANVPVVKVTGVTVTPATATLNAGLTTQLTATVAPSNATNQTVSWTSGNTAVATVSATGLVTGIAAGTAVITATTADGGKTATATVIVNAASSFTVYFYKPSTWGSGINIYYWNTVPSGVLAGDSWPGVPMTNDNNGWYSYTFTNIDSTDLIFNDGTNQTANLSRGSDGWYENGVWYDSNPGTLTTYYQIVNRWQANTYLYDGGNGKVLYGTSPSGNSNYQWTQVSAGNGYVYLQNRGTGNYMHVQDQTGYVECGAIQSAWYSAMWSIADAGTGEGWDYIENRWQANQWIHIQDLLGYAEYANAQTGWYSAMWQFVNPVTVPNAIGPALRSGLTPGLAADSAVAASILLYPNPAPGGSFYLSLPNQPGNFPAMVIISNTEGKILLVTQLMASGPIMHPLAAGTYFVTIRMGRIMTTKKLTVL